jgi:Integrase core domain
LSVPRHRVTGDRSQHLRGRKVETFVGYTFAHAIVDDHSRLAYVELHDDEKAATVTAFVARSLDWFALHGVNAKRLMTDNAWCYIHNRSLRELLGAHQIKHGGPRPTVPRPMERWSGSTRPWPASGPTD